MSSDSVSYAACARSLLEGQGFYSHSELYTRWPPLFPVFLAVLGLAGLEVMDASRWFNAACFGLAVYGFHHILRKGLRSQALVFTGAASLLLLDPLLKCSMMILSETLFTLLAILFTIAMQSYVEKPSGPKLIMVSALAAMAGLTRYFGVALIPAGCLIMLAGLTGAPWQDRLRRAAIFSAAAFAPQAAWLARNFFHTGSLTGLRGNNPFSLFEILEIVSRSITGFVFPQAFPLWVRLVLVAMALSAFFAVGRKYPVPEIRAWTLPKTMASLALASGAFITYSYWTTCLDPVADRYLAPVHFAFVFLALYFLDRVMAWAPLPGHGGKFIRAAIIGVCILWVGSQALHVASRTSLVLGNPGKSLGWIEKTASMHPEPSILMTKGQALYDLGRFAEAAGTFEEAAGLGKAPGPAWLMAGKAALAAGDKREAANALERAALDPSVREEARSLLDGLDSIAPAATGGAAPVRDSP